MVSINGEMIYQVELERRARLVGVDANDPRFFEQLVLETVMLQEAKALGLSVAKHEIDDFVAEARQTAGGQQALRESLNGQGLSMRDLRLDAERRLLLLRYTDTLTQDIAVSETQLRAYFQLQREVLSNPERYEVTLFAFENVEQAEAARDSLLAEEDLDDSASLRREDLELSGDTGDYQLLELARKTSFNTPSDVFELEDGFVYILVPLRYYRAKEARFEEVANGLRTQLEQLAGQRLIDKHISELREQASIVWIEDESPE